MTAAQEPRAGEVLKPCPVCEGAAEIVNDGAKPDDGFRFVRCTSVTSCEETDWYPSEAEAIAAWNTRPSEVHPCADEHQAGCDCAIPAQTAQPMPSYLERLSRPSESSASVGGGEQKLLLKLIDTLKPLAEVAEKLSHCHVVEICEPHPDNPSPNIVPMPREWFERAADDLESVVMILHRDAVLSEGQASKLTGLDRVAVRKQVDALRTQASAREGERITTAAIQHSSGIIVTIERPGRHGQCINFLNRCGLDYKEGHGFLTSHGRFVDRQQAAVIAVEAGQGSPRPQCNGNLFSEDLWPEALSRQPQEGEGRE